MIDKDLILKFSAVQRFSGSFVFQSESVPDHSVQMALLCCNFSELVEESDKFEMCYRCLIHDFEETITSDIVRPIKHHSPEIKKLIDKAGFDLLSENSSPEFAREVFDAKNSNNINGFLVEIADKIQCFLKMRMEVEILGNKTLKRDFENFKLSVHYYLDLINNCDLMSDNSKINLAEYINNLIINY